ncbi:MAG: helix-hairpin-helix domain-containing protein [Candidatus Aminicenantes bacterium]|nr:helix-hairpin-helix domain-containing protein [Candidatus Aminicenantes bacterium]
MKDYHESLESIPGIGPKLASDLKRLGIQKVYDLKQRDPERLYDRLCALKGCRIDRCVLYCFRCAVHYAQEEKPRPELLKWWNWKNRKLESTQRKGTKPQYGISRI